MEGRDMNEVSYKIIMLHLKRRIKTLNEERQNMSREDERVVKDACDELRRAIRIIETEVKSVEKNGPRVDRDLDIMKELYEEIL